jgi:hypothetical protein
VKYSPLKTLSTLGHVFESVSPPLKYSPRVWYIFKCSVCGFKIFVSPSKLIHYEYKSITPRLVGGYLSYWCESRIVRRNGELCLYPVYFEDSMPWEDIFLIRMLSCDEEMIKGIIE